MSLYHDLGRMVVSTDPAGNDPLGLLSDVIDQHPTDLYHAGGLVAAWDAEELRHVMSWADVWYALSESHLTLDKVRLSAAGGSDVVDVWDIQQVLDEWQIGVDLDLADFEGGRVRPADDGGWLAELPGSGLILGVFPSPVAARNVVERHVEDARAQAREVLREHGDSRLAMVARATWQSARTEVWATRDELERLDPWIIVDIANACGVSSIEAMRWREQGMLPAPDYPAGQDRRHPANKLEWWEQVSIIEWAKRTERRCDPDRALRFRQWHRRRPNQPEDD